MWKTAPKTLTAYFLERMKDFLSLEHKFNFFFLDCQDDNSIFSLDRLFYTRVSSHMCHPDTFRITGHYSTLSALFFAAQNSLSFLFLQSEILRESIHVTNAVHFPETSETNQTEEEKLQSFRSIRTKQGTNEENMKNCWCASFLLSFSSFIYQTRKKLKWICWPRCEIIRSSEQQFRTFSSLIITFCSSQNYNENHPSNMKLKTKEVSLPGGRSSWFLMKNKNIVSSHATAIYQIRHHLP